MMSDAITRIELRHQGMKLLKECWKPVLAVLLLTNLLSIISHVIMQPVPVEPGDTISLSALQAGGEIPTVNVVIGVALQLIEAFILLPLLMLGLYKGLLSHLRGNGCTLPIMASTAKRWRTAIALDFLIFLRILGYELLGILAVVLLSFIPILGPLGAAIGYVVLMYWVALRYFCAQIHLADDAECQLNATDCITYSLHDAEMYSISGVFKTLWPAFLPATFASLLTEFLPASLAVSIISVVLNALSAVMKAAYCVAIYAHLRTDLQSSQEALPENEGLARARALAQEESPN